MRESLRSIVCGVVLVGSVVGCRESASPSARPVKVSVTSGAAGVTVVNGTELPVGYLVGDPEFLALLDLCNSPQPGCVRLAPGASVVVPFEQASGYAATTHRLIAMTWHVKPDASGNYFATDIRADTVEIAH